MKPAVLSLEIVPEGTTWRGIPSIDIDPDVVSDLVEVVLQFKRGRFALHATQSAAPVIDDAALWTAHVPPMILDMLTPGLWFYDVLFRAADGTVYIPITGKLKITPSSSKI